MAAGNMFSGIIWPERKNSSIITTKRKVDISRNQKARVPMTKQKSMPMEKAVTSETTKAAHSQRVGMWLKKCRIRKNMGGKVKRATYQKTSLWARRYMTWYHR